MSAADPPEAAVTESAQRPQFAYDRLSPGVPRESDVDDDELEALFCSPPLRGKEVDNGLEAPSTAKQASDSPPRASSDPLALDSQAAETDELDSSDGFVVLSDQGSSRTTPVPIAGPSTTKPPPVPPPPRKRLRLDVVIPLMPMDEVHTYIMHGRTRYPTDRSRRRYAPSAYSDASTSEASTSRGRAAAPQPRRAPARSTGRKAGYRISSSSPVASEADFGGYGPDDWSPRRSVDQKDDDEEEEEEVELIEDSEDELMARRARTGGQDRGSKSQQDGRSRRDTRQTRPRRRARDSVSGFNPRSAYGRETIRPTTFHSFSRDVRLLAGITHTTLLSVSIALSFLYWWRTTDLSVWSSTAYPTLSLILAHDIQLF